MPQGDSHLFFVESVDVYRHIGHSVIGLISLTLSTLKGFDTAAHTRSLQIHSKDAQNVQRCNAIDIFY